MRMNKMTMDGHHSGHIDFSYNSEDPHLFTIQTFKEGGDGKLLCTSITINAQDARSLRDFLYSFDGEFQRRNGNADI